MPESNPTRPWGPDNPHPLSTMKTELVWEGKYDEFGNRREVDVAGSSMPMQRIETIDQPRSEASSSFFGPAQKKPGLRATSVNHPNPPGKTCRLQYQL